MLAFLAVGGALSLLCPWATSVDSASAGSDLHQADADGERQLDTTSFLHKTNKRANNYDQHTKELTTSNPI